MLEGLREEQRRCVEAEAAEARERRAQYEARKAAREREREEQAARQQQQQEQEQEQEGLEGQEEERRVVRWGARCNDGRCTFRAPPSSWWARAAR